VTTQVMKAIKVLSMIATVSWVWPVLGTNGCFDLRHREFPLSGAGDSPILGKKKLKSW